MKTTALAFAAALGLFASAATPALAAEDPQIAVSYKDLNLASAEGQAKLKRRLDDAARKVCGMDKIATGTRIQSAASVKCFARARQQIGEAFATVLENERLGG